MIYTLYYAKAGKLAFPVSQFRALKRKYARKMLANMAESFCHSVPDNETHYILAVNPGEEIISVFDIERGTVCGELSRTHHEDFMLVCW